MHTYLRAIGFRECKNRQQLEDIYRHTLNTPNRKIMTTISSIRRCCSLKKILVRISDSRSLVNMTSRVLLSIETLFSLFEGRPVHAV